MQRLVIYGAGGFGREVASMAIRAGRTDLVFASDEAGAPVMGIRVIAPNRILPEDDVVIAVGNSPIRARIDAAHPEIKWGSLFAATSIIGHDVEIGSGAIFCDHTMVTASAKIGRHFECNIYSYVTHDCVIGDYVTFGPRVSCNGHVHIEDGAHIAASVTIRNGTAEKPIVIGAGAFIGMGAVVTKDVPPGSMFIGNPARAIQPPSLRRAS